MTETRTFTPVIEYITIIRNGVATTYSAWLN